MTVLAGFLGSGKTTLVNHLLRQADGPRIMVLVNDFGDLPIDEDLIAAKDGDTLTLANGCACCSMGAGLYKAFSTALDYEPTPDHLLIEASGVAEPKRIANFARAEPDLTLNGIVTMVDALNFQTTREDQRLSEIVEAQISSAHILLLNKCDLAQQQNIDICAEILRHVNETAPIIKITHGALSGDIFFGEGRSIDRLSETSNDSHSHTHETDFSRWSVATDSEINKATLKEVLNHLPPSILRVKGIFRATGESDLWVAHKAGTHIDISPLSMDSSFSGRTGFVAIGTKSPDFSNILDAAFHSLK
ncbi:CobW family GTP-binding protein [Sneathiella sp. HT1-7]|uniref:CobW family GTP-binding protein n=1 Tax=Sneathiella sp. HT1-7 TaxID=2887192 RepID=UPI001D14DF21|nr:GTP-binding protein [Sneathiella sp. HT1-7]MCC3303353.1 GTP-binding protein [Sneathiella sp. HT1-7]